MNRSRRSRGGRSRGRRGGRGRGRGRGRNRRKPNYHDRKDKFLDSVGIKYQKKTNSQSSRQYYRKKRGNNNSYRKNNNNRSEREHVLTLRDILLKNEGIDNNTSDNPNESEEERIKRKQSEFDHFNHLLISSVSVYNQRESSEWAKILDSSSTTPSRRHELEESLEMKRIENILLNTDLTEKLRIYDTDLLPVKYQKIKKLEIIEEDLEEEESEGEEENDDEVEKEGENIKEQKIQQQNSKKKEEEEIIENEKKGEGNLEKEIKEKTSNQETSSPITEDKFFIEEVENNNKNEGKKKQEDEDESEKPEERNEDDDLDDLLGI